MLQSYREGIEGKLKCVAQPYVLEVLDKGVEFCVTVELYVIRIAKGDARSGKVCSGYKK